MERPTIHEFYGELAKLYKERATCPRRKCSALFVKDKRLIVAGYNGAVAGAPHCSEAGCLMVEQHCSRAVHAERSAIYHAANAGIALDGCDVYISGGTPCLACAQGLVATRTKTVYVDNFYPDRNAVDFLKENGVRLVGLFTETERKVLENFVDKGARPIDLLDEIVEVRATLPVVHAPFQELRKDSGALTDTGKPEKIGTMDVYDLGRLKPRHNPSLEDAP